MAQPKDLWSRQVATDPSSYRFGGSGSTGGTMPNQGVINPGQSYPYPNINVTNTNQQGNGKNSLLNSLMSPDAIGAIGYGGLGLLENLFTNRAQAQQGEANRGLDRQKMLIDLITKQSSVAGDQLNDSRSRDASYMNSFAMDPVGQQKDIFQAGALRALAQQGAPQVSPGHVGTVDFSGPANQFFGDDQLAGAASRFYGAQGTLSNTAPTANLASMGFGGQDALQSGMNNDVAAARAKREQLVAEQRALLDKAQGVVTGPADANTDPAAGAKKSTPWWKKALKIAAFAAPIAAAPFTGGASLAAIGALSGAGGAALNGGHLTDILMGAGLGSIPGIGGAGKAASAIKPTLSAGLKQAGKSALKSSGSQMLSSYLANGGRR